MKGATTLNDAFPRLLTPYAFPYAPQSIAEAKSCECIYARGNDIVAVLELFSLESPHCGLLSERMGEIKV